jgi:hypothetical protein
MLIIGVRVILKVVASMASHSCGSDTLLPQFDGIIFAIAVFVAV